MAQWGGAWVWGCGAGGVAGGRPRSPGTRGAALNAMQARLQRWATSRQARHLANVANSALLLLTFPASLRGGLLSGLALHRLLTSAWVSGFGGMLLMRERRRHESARGRAG